MAEGMSAIFLCHLIEINDVFVRPNFFIPQTFPYSNADGKGICRFLLEHWCRFDPNVSAQSAKYRQWRKTGSRQLCRGPDPTSKSIVTPVDKRQSRLTWPRSDHPFYTPPPNYVRLNARRQREAIRRAQNRSRDRAR